MFGVEHELLAPNYIEDGLLIPIGLEIMYPRLLTAAKEYRRRLRYDTIYVALWRNFFTMCFYLPCGQRGKPYSTFVHSVKMRPQILVQSLIGVITKHFRKGTEKGRLMVETTQPFGHITTRSLHFCASASAKPRSGSISASPAIIAFNQVDH